MIFVNFLFSIRSKKNILKNSKQIPRTCIATTWIWYGGLFMWIHLEIISTERVSRLDHTYIAFLRGKSLWLFVVVLVVFGVNLNEVWWSTDLHQGIPYYIPPLLTTCLQTEISGLVAAYYNARLKLNTVFSLSLFFCMCLTSWTMCKAK